MNYDLLLRQFSSSSGFPIYLYRGKELISRYQDDIQDYSLSMYLMASLPEKLPSIWLSAAPEYFYFGGLYVKKLDAFLLLAPLFPVECSMFQIKKILRRLNRSDRFAADFFQNMQKLPLCNVSRLQNTLIFLNNLLNGIPESDVRRIDFHWKNFWDFSSPVIEPAISPLSAEDPEKAILAMIHSGNEQALTDYFDKYFFSSYPVFFVEDIRQEKQFLTGANMLMSRAATSAGVDGRLMSNLAGYYYTRLDEAQTPSDLTHIFYQSAKHYVRLVASLNTFPSNSVVVNKINRYVQAHLYEKIKLSAIAEELHYHVSYLCTEFKQSTGITIVAFITEKKIREACFLLEAGFANPSEISEALCFSSYSYFCKTFKKVTGHTPGTYLHATDFLL